MTKSKHPLFKMWCSLRNVYTNPNNCQYKYYGGRGLTMSRDWMMSFEQFCEDIESYGPKPYKRSILERKNVNKGHSRSNCQWATRKINANHRRSNWQVTYQGRTQSLADWSRELGINHRTLWSRLYDRGYTVKETFTRPLHWGNRRANIK
jgi:hypothetical protein